MAGVSSTSLTIAEGVSIPVIGFGTYKIDPKECYAVVKNALKAGYRHIDTAEFYKNEVEVAAAMKDSGIKREEMFVTSKVWDARGEKAVRELLTGTLKAMGLKYIDLYLIHSPNGGRLVETYEAMLKLRDEGLVRAVGVSNFGVHHLEGLAEAKLEPPAVNQIELHPFLQQEKIVSYCKKNNIAVEAYSPLTAGKFIKHETITKIASQIGKGNANIMIRWSIQSGFIVLPKSTDPDRIKQNFDVFSWALSEEQMTELNALEADEHTTWDPTTVPWQG